MTHLRLWDDLEKTYVVDLTTGEPVKFYDNESATVAAESDQNAEHIRIDQFDGDTFVQATFL